MISWSTAPRQSRQKFQPSGKGSIWIPMTRVQATCNLESIVITVMQLSFEGHHLRNYNSKAIVQRPHDPNRTKWTDGGRWRRKRKTKTSILRVGATCACARWTPNYALALMKGYTRNVCGSILRRQLTEEVLIKQLNGTRELTTFAIPKQSL